MEEGAGGGHWKTSKLVVRGIKECMDENCNFEEGGSLQGAVELSIC